MWAPKVEKPDEIAGATRRQHGDFSIGCVLNPLFSYVIFCVLTAAFFRPSSAVNTTLTVVDGHPMMLLTGGNQCSNGGELRASTAVRFICDTSVFGAGTLYTSRFAILRNCIFYTIHAVKSYVQDHCTHHLIFLFCRETRTYCSAPARRR